VLTADHTYRMDAVQPDLIYWDLSTVANCKW
jgi:hypothetical protein